MADQMSWPSDYVATYVATDEGTGAWKGGRGSPKSVYIIG